MSVRNEAINLYIRLGLPRPFTFLGSLLESSIHRKWLVPVVLFIFLILKTSTAIKFFLFENRVWTRKSYQAGDLAPFYPHVGDLPRNVLQASLEDVTAYVRSHLQRGQSRSIAKIRYWLSQETIFPAIVLEPPLPRSPFSDAKGYLLDGNHRAIAMALKGELIRAYVGISHHHRECKCFFKRSLDCKSEYIQKYSAISNIHTYKDSLTSVRDQLVTLIESDFVKSEVDRVLKTSARTYLDLGTGTGRIITHVERYVERSLGLDTSAAMISFSRHNTKRSSFLRGDAEYLPFQPSSFELVTCFRLFINLPTNVRNMLLLEIRQVLKNKGILVIDDHCNKLGLTGILGSLRGKLSSNKNDPYKRYSLMTPFQMSHELRSAGFDPYKSLCTFLPTISRIPFIPPLMQLKIDRCLVRLPLLWLFADIIVLAAHKR